MAGYIVPNLWEERFLTSKPFSTQTHIAGASAPYDASLSAAYGLNEGSGVVATDGSGNGPVATLVGAAGWTDAGVFGGALLLDGTGGGLEVPAGDALVLPHAFTIEAWVKPAAGFARRRYVVQMPGGTGEGLRLTAAGRPVFAASFGSGTGIVVGWNPVPIDTWTHLAVTYDGTMLRLYVDGREAGSRSAAGGLAAVEPQSMWVGRARTGAAFAGAIDEARIYRRALSDTDIAADMHAPIVGPARCTYAVTPPRIGVEAATSSGRIAVMTERCPWAASADVDWIALTDKADGYRGGVLADEAVGYWRLDEDEGVQAADGTGNGFDGEFFEARSHGAAGATADGNAATRFDGGYVQFARPVPLSDGAFTFEAWVRYDVNGWGTVARGPGWSLTIREPRLALRVDTGETVLADLQTTRALDDGEWHHVTATVDPVVLRVQLFVDGALDASGAIDGEMPAGQTMALLGPLTADLDEVAVYRSVLAPAQIGSHFDARTSVSGGSGVLAYTVAANPSTRSRSGVVTVADQAVPLVQDGRRCVAVAPETIEIDAAGGSGEIAVTAADAECEWMATASASWITLQSASGTGTGLIRYTIAENTAVLDRVGGMSVAGLSVAVTQRGTAVVRPGKRYSMAVGRQHTLGLQDDGRVWSWGANEARQLGDGTTLSRSMPVLVAGVADAVALAAGGEHSLALRSDGSVWGWGANSAGQLGDGTQAIRTGAVQSAVPADVVAIVAGSEHSVALDAEGYVWTWGRNFWGQLGDGTTLTRPLPIRLDNLPSRVVSVAAAESRTVLVDANGVLWTFGHGQLTPVQIPLAEPVVAAVATGAATFAVALDGTVWAWGVNDRGQLGIGTTNSPQEDPQPVASLEAPTRLAAGVSHAVAVMPDGLAWVWGGNEAGQLGDGTAVCPEGSDYGCPGRQYSATPLVVAGVSDLIAVAAGGDNTVVVTGGGELWAWGRNDERQLGDGTNRPRTRPVQIAEGGFTWLTATPLLDRSATYLFQPEIHATSNTAGAVIHYTLDGRDPVETDPVMPAAPAGLPIARTTAVKARAWAPGRPPSNIASETYTLQVPAPLFSPAAGTFGAAVTVSLSTAVADAVIRYTTDGTEPTAASPLYESPITVGTRTVIKALAFKEGWVASKVASATYLMSLGTLAAPGVSPPAGTYVYGEPIVLTAAALATVHYTIDGSMPTTSSPMYVDPIVLAGALTIRAAAFHPDWTPSAVAVASFEARAGAPVFSPPGGAYPADQRITITAGTPGVTVRYTTNGLDPSVNDPIVADGEVLPVGNYTLKARAFRTDLLASDVATAEYSRLGDSCRYTVAPPVINIGPAAAGGLIALSGSEAGCSWTASTDEAWLSVTPAAGGGATGQIAYYASRNPSSSIRTSLIRVGDVDVLVVQGGTVACDFDVTPRAAAVTADGGAGELVVDVSDGSCGWTASTDVPWLSLAMSGGDGAYAQAVISDHPLGFWPLSGGEPAVADRSGFGRHGTAHGGVAFTERGPLADRSTAAAFDGATAYIHIPHDAAFDVTAVTWEAWIRIPAQSAASRQILGKGGADEVFSLSIGPHADRATVSIGLGDARRPEITLPSIVVGAGWVHIAITADETIWRAYVNGVEVHSEPTGSTLATSSDPIVAGREGLYDGWYDGQLADVALYPYVLSADQIANHVAQQPVAWRGGGRLRYTVAANDAGAARTGAVTLTGMSVPITQAAPGGVAIAASRSPLPNAAGWNNSDVTVTFVCGGTGAIVCPPPVTLGRDGEYDVPGQAVNDAGDTATTTIRVRLDKTPPYVSIASPVVGQLVAPGEVAVTGMVVDALSSTAAVTCNDLPATVTDTSFVCSPLVASGASVVVVRAMDVASNAREVVIPVTLEDEVVSAPPASLRLSPQRVTMLAGETRGFSVMDDLGRIPADVEWTVDNPAVAMLSLTPAVTLTAVSGGDVTLSATWRGLTAAAYVTVVGGGDMPLGTTLWSAPQAGNADTIVQGVTAPDGIARTFVREDRTIRAFDGDGRELWTTFTPASIHQFAADPGGGAVAMVAFDDRLDIFAFGPNGGSGRVATGVWPGFALHPDGALYTVRVEGDTPVLTSIDIGYGAGVSAPIPPGVLTTCSYVGGGLAGCSSRPEHFDWGAPTIMPDGRVAVPFLGGERLENVLVDPEAAYGPPPGRCDAELQVMFLSPDGSTDVQSTGYREYCTSAQWNLSIYPMSVIPNGRGGVLVKYNQLNALEWSAVVVGLDAAGSVTGGMRLGDWWAGLVVGEDGRVHTTTGWEGHAGMIVSLTAEGNPASTADFVNADQAVTSVVAAAGGGFIASFADGMVIGPSPEFSQMRLRNLSHAGGNKYLGMADNAFVAVAGPDRGVPNSVWPASASAQAAQAAVKLGTGILAKSHNAVWGMYPSHASLRIAPRDTDYWITRTPTLFRDELGNDIKDSYGNLFFTIGAGPEDGDSNVSCGGVLKSDRNRPSDVTTPAERLELLQYPPVLEKQLIQRLINLDGNYRDDLPYACIPELVSDAYNSNSYVSGLLQVADIPAPSFPIEFWSEYPGWTKPVPMSRFLSSQRKK